MPTKAIATTPANPFPSAELQVAAQLTDQYRKAVSGSREMLIFGAMFMGLGRVLQPQNTVAENGQITGREGGLKGWIENNCPSINYNTAYKFYGLAKKLREGLAIHVNTDVYRLLTAPVHELSKKESKIRLEMDEAIDGKSAYQLEWDLGVRKARTSLPESGGAREGPAASRRASPASRSKSTPSSQTNPWDPLASPSWKSAGTSTCTTKRSRSSSPSQNYSSAIWEGRHDVRRRKMSVRWKEAVHDSAMRRMPGCHEKPPFHGRVQRYAAADVIAPPCRHGPRNPVQESQIHSDHQGIIGVRPCSSPTPDVPNA